MKAQENATGQLTPIAPASEGAESIEELEWAPETDPTRHNIATKARQALAYLGRQVQQADKQTLAAAGTALLFFYITRKRPALRNLGITLLAGYLSNRLEKRLE